MYNNFWNKIDFLRNSLTYFYKVSFFIKIACLAQRPERRTCNAMVIGSTPIAGLVIKRIFIIFNLKIRLKIINCYLKKGFLK